MAIQQKRTKYVYSIFERLHYKTVFFIITLETWIRSIQIDTYRSNFRFAKQAGASHIVVQLVDYIKGGDNPSLIQNYLDGWGVTENENKLWEYEDLYAYNPGLIRVK